MKLLTVKEIKEMAFQYLHKNYKCHNGDNGSIFTKGLNPGRELDKSDLVLLIIKIYSQAQRDIIESASEGYSIEEMRNAYDFSGGNFHGMFNDGLHKHLIKTGERLWQACSLSHAKKMQEKDESIEVLLSKHSEAHGNWTACEEIIKQKEGEIKRLRQAVSDRNQYKLNQEGLDKAHAIYEEQIQKLQHQLEIQTKRVENLKDYVKLHLPPIFDSECEGCRCAESASIKGLKIDQELEKQLEEVNVR